MATVKKPHVVDVTEQTFETLVRAESFKRPVVVDFWAPWCAPCRALGPVLEKLAAQGAGSWVLAKLNTDEAATLSSEFRIQGIPAVKAFKDGAVVSAFEGALPEGRVRTWLEGFLPGEAEALIATADAALALGQLDEAEVVYERALDDKPRAAGALLGLAKVAAARGDAASAERHLGLVLAADEAQVAGESARIRLTVRGRAAGDEASLEARLAANSSDLEARVGLGLWAAGAGRNREALDFLLGVVAHDRGALRDSAREAMLLIFELAGQRSELTEEYRQKLALELFK